MWQSVVEFRAVDAFELNERTAATYNVLPRILMLGHNVENICTVHVHALVKYYAKYTQNYT